MSSLRSSLRQPPMLQAFKLIILFLVVLTTGAVSSRAMDHEFPINTTKEGSQIGGSIAVDSGGNFVVVWSSGLIWWRPDARRDVFLQRFDRTLGFLGPETRVNTHASGTHGGGSVDIDAQGNILIVWGARDPGVTGEGGFGRHFDKFGNPMGPEFQVNSRSAGRPGAPVLAMNDSGAFVVTWEVEYTFAPSELYARFYDSSSNPIGPEFLVTQPQMGIFWPCTEMDNDGHAIVVWRECHDPRACEGGIFGQRYDAYGSLLGTKFQIDTAEDSQHGATDIAMDREGDFVVTWSAGADPEKYFQNDIKARLYSRSGTPVSKEFLVNTTTDGDQLDPAVAMDPAGGFVVFWESEPSDGKDTFDIFGQRFDSSGDRIGDEFQANTYTYYMQLYPAVAVSDALIFVTWIDWGGHDGDGLGVFGRGFSNDPVTAVDSPPVFQPRLFQNRPNPFNPTTTIAFVLPERTSATLAVYDVSGRLVKTLVNGMFDGGYEEYQWNGADAAGSRVSSGVYFYRLTAGNRTLTKKMVLLK